MMAVIYAILGSSAIGGIVTYILTRGRVNAERDKLRAEAEGVILENMKRYSDVVKVFVAPLEEKVGKLEIEVEHMKPFLCKKENCINRFFS